MALINEYRPGAPIGWHRDAPQYEVVAGLSLLSACHMKFRPVPLSRSSRTGGCSAIGHSRGRPRASVRVPDDARVAKCLRTPHSAGSAAALFDHVSNVTVIVRRERDRAPGHHVLTPSEVHQRWSAAEGQTMRGKQGCLP
jgi:hypothetical protein